MYKYLVKSRLYSFSEETRTRGVYVDYDKAVQRRNYIQEFDSCDEVWIEERFPKELT